MKEIYVIDILPDEEITDFFMIKKSEIRTGSNNKEYLDIVLADKTGEIGGKKWDVAGPEADTLYRLKAGDIVKVRATVNEWNGSLQLKVQRIRAATDADKLEKADFIKAAPEKPEDMYDYILGVAKGLSDEDFKAVALKLLEDNKQRLLYWPAAKSNHHAIYAGLLYHVKRMLMMADSASKVYTNLNRDLLLTGVIIHDIEKLNEMDSDQNGIVSEYTFEGNLLGHLVAGVKTIDHLKDEIGLSNEKAVMLEHMMISHHYEPDFGSPKKPLFPEAEALHYMDMLDSKMYDMEDALRTVKGGEFSDRIWSLDNRRLYKSTFTHSGTD
ncbi:MAG: HD domain-containing protein [Clostridiales Family XIII bacterium]|jgi:3'-5' exoribonuclease|nr:HD domain-containing protein [Clostridiales Family XIII bacterium]